MQECLRQPQMPKLGDAILIMYNNLFLGTLACCTFPRTFYSQTVCDVNVPALIKWTAGRALHIQRVQAFRGHSAWSPDPSRRSNLLPNAFYSCSSYTVSMRVYKNPPRTFLNGFSFQNRQRGTY